MTTKWHWRTTGSILASVAIGALLTMAASDAHAATAGDACAQLKGLQLPEPTTIDRTESISASAQVPWVSPSNLFTQNLPAHGVTVTTPFCRVAGTIHPTPKSSIRFELWLPLAENWNNKFVGTAAGGSTGAILYQSMVEPLTRGYAAMAHDNGHVSKNSYEQTWAFDETTRTVKVDQIVDFGYRAQHVVTVVSKALASHYYGTAPSRSYYVGCSQSGHHGMMEAQRYPDDYDGIVAGAHGGDWMRMMSTEAWGATRILASGRLTDGQLLSLKAAVLKSCDGRDGLKDGQIDNPKACKFDPKILQCAPGKPVTDSCLSKAQVSAVTAIYSGPRYRSSGRSVSPGYALGSEGNWNHGSPMGNPEGGSFYDFYRLILKRDPKFDIRDLDWNKDIDQGRAEYGEIFDATDTDLSGFKARGGKLILYHGWADPLITPYLSIDYYMRLQQRMGSTADFARLFMIPGMGHCAGGPLANVDWLSAIDNWVANGTNPDGRTTQTTLIATGTIGDKRRSRPLCPYPSTAKYLGSGDINLASSFACTPARDPVK